MKTVIANGKNQVKSSLSFNSGFTLIEVLLALTLAGLIIGVLAGSFQQATVSQQILNGRVAAVTLGQGKLAEIVAGIEKASSGEFMVSGKKYRWVSQTEDVADGCTRIELTVEWGNHIAPFSHRKQLQGWRYSQ